MTLEETKENSNNSTNCWRGVRYPRIYFYSREFSLFFKESKVRSLSSKHWLSLGWMKISKYLIRDPLGVCASKKQWPLWRFFPSFTRSLFFDSQKILQRWLLLEAAAAAASLNSCVNTQKFCHKILKMLSTKTLLILTSSSSSSPPGMTPSNQYTQCCFCVRWGDEIIFQTKHTENVCI